MRSAAAGSSSTGSRSRAIRTRSARFRERPVIRTVIGCSNPVVGCRRRRSEPAAISCHAIGPETSGTMEPPMTVSDPEPRAVRRGREARQAARLARAIESEPYLTRRLAPVEVVSTEGLELIEHNADTLLEDVG